jgi:hypothetical protein
MKSGQLACPSPQITACYFNKKSDPQQLAVGHNYLYFKGGQFYYRLASLMPYENKISLLLHSKCN